MPYASEKVAKKLGAWGGQPNARYLWTLSKRELIEIALHLAAQTSGVCDDALENGDAVRLVLAEREALAQAKLI